MLTIKLHHYITLMFVRCKIASPSNISQIQQGYPEDVDVNKFLPTAADSNALIQNFKVLMKRILVHYLPAVSHLADVNQHITHEWTAHMSMKSVVVSYARMNGLPYILLVNHA